MAEQNQYLDLLALPKEIIGLIFNKLDVIEEIRTHHCIAKWWNETYWSTLTGVNIDSKAKSFLELEDRHLRYILSRVNPLKLYSLNVFKKAPKLTSSSLSLLSQFINLKFLRLHGIPIDQIRQTVTSLVSLRELDMRAIQVDNDFIESIADNLPKLTRLQIVESEQLLRWPKAYKLTNLNELTLALIRNFTANGYADIAKLSNLTFLNVNANSNLDNESLKHILSMTNLQELNFMHANVTLPSAYSGLVKLTKLQRLAGHILPDEETLSYLSQVYSLTTLRVEGRQLLISAKFISPLTNLKQLIDINMKDTNLLTTLTNLETLNALTQNISEEFPLQVLTNLMDIRVNAIESKAFQKFQSLVKLKSLIVGSILDSQENNFDGIQYCQNLQNLRYSGPQLSVQQFGYITQCTQLSYLSVVLPPQCADNFSNLTQLTSLEVRGLDWKMEHFQKLTILTQLKYLTIRGSKSLRTREDSKAVQNLFSPDIVVSLRSY